MAIYKSDIVDIDLADGTIHRSFAQRTLGEGDANGNRFGIRLWRNGERVIMSNVTCMGYFIRNGNGDTVVINGGTFNGQEAYVELPAACYVYEGSFSLVIKLTEGNITGTMRVVDGTVVNSSTGSFIDPGSTIPDLATLLAVVERAEAAAEVVNDLEIYAELISGNNYDIVVNMGGGS